MNDSLSFDLPKNQSSVIKVIGVGGGGSNAVNHMYKQGIRGVDFVVCNTDAQALENSPVPNKVQLGVSLTEGLGAGANPEVGNKAARESLMEISRLLEKNTKMVFITAGMGGGTGTGAAPVIAKAAKEMGILTVGIVTVPFTFEGSTRMKQAEVGVDELRASVDSLIVINNNKLREVYGNLGFKAGFAKADEVLATAARGIAEVITHHYTTNIDLRDARTVLADSGTAIMGSGQAEGPDRALNAVTGALDSPLLNDNHIRGAQNVLLLIVSGSEEITIDEIGEINDHIQAQSGGSSNIIMGIGEDDSLGRAISVTVVATGFSQEKQMQVIHKEPQKVVHVLDEDQSVTQSVYERPLSKEEEAPAEAKEEPLPLRNKVQHNLFDMFEQPAPPKVHPIPPAPEAPNFEEPLDQLNLEETEERVVFNLVEEVEEPTTVGEVVAEPMLDHTALAPETAEPEMLDETEMLDELENEEAEPFIHFSLHEEEILEEEDEVHAPIHLESSPEEVSFVFHMDHEEPMEELAEEEVLREEEEIFRFESHREEMVAAAFDQPLDAPSEETNYPTAETPQEEPVKRYTLEDLSALEERLGMRKAAAPPEEPKAKVDNDLEFEYKLKAEESKPSSQDLPVGDPFDQPISASIHLRAEERKSRLKAFNYRFKNAPHNLHNAEEVPAYRRMGVELNNTQFSQENRVSRFTLGGDKNDDELRTNNSFLHDNVD